MEIIKIWRGGNYRCKTIVWDHEFVKIVLLFLVYMFKNKNLNICTAYTIWVINISKVFELIHIGTLNSVFNEKFYIFYCDT